MDEGMQLLYYMKGFTIYMNDKNYDLFFNQEDEETTLLTVTDADGNDLDVEPIANMEIEELNKEYIATFQINATTGEREEELLLFRYSENEDGEPILEGIDDDEELTSVSAAFMQYFQSQLQS